MLLFFNNYKTNYKKSFWYRIVNIRRRVKLGDENGRIVNAVEKRRIKNPLACTPWNVYTCIYNGFMSSARIHLYVKHLGHRGSSQIVIIICKNDYFTIRLLPYISVPNIKQWVNRLCTASIDIFKLLKILFN